MSALAPPHPFAPLLDTPPAEVRPVIHVKGETPKSKRTHRFVFFYDHKRDKGDKVCEVKAYTFAEACTEFLTRHYPKLKGDKPNLGAYWMKHYNTDTHPVRQTNVRNWYKHYQNGTNPLRLL